MHAYKTRVPTRVGIGAVLLLSEAEAAPLLRHKLIERAPVLDGGEIDPDAGASVSVVAAVDTLATYHGLTFEQVVAALEREVQNTVGGSGSLPAEGGGGPAPAAAPTPDTGLAETGADAPAGAGSGERGDPAPAAALPADQPSKSRRVTGTSKGGSK